MQRIGDPEEGTALWTTLTDPADIENALKERAKQREEELLKHNEHIKESNSSTRNGIVPADEMNVSIESRNLVVNSEEIAELIKAAKEATASAKEASTSAKEATAAAERAASAANGCCTIM